MTQKEKDAQRLAELNTLFLTLDNTGQDSALTVLRALEFAQSVTRTPKAEEQPCDSSKHTT
ncbi:hypothetical protein [Allofournierella sp.]|uniref:hypothetical protein n=1 Tax=Allofournierella sp. TaxID=1940256 RepID=UPI003AB73DE8